jgi:hypothetical protein
MNQCSVVPNPDLVKPSLFYSVFALPMGKNSVVPNSDLVKPMAIQIS